MAVAEQLQEQKNRLVHVEWQWELRNKRCRASGAAQSGTAESVVWVLWGAAIG